MNAQKRIAFHFIILLGIVSLFGDITYEGARSIVGPYLAVLGASAAVVGMVAGLGEFIGYTLRLVFGYLADRTKAYWPLTIIGYALILFVPLLAVTGHWQVAIIFIILERMGKAVRSPARDAMLSHATKQVGRGWGFGIHEALDQIGAVAGPLIFTFVFLFKGTYRQGLTILWIPAVLLLGILAVARARVPVPEELEVSGKTNGQDPPDPPDKKRLPKVFWLYALFIFVSVAGFFNFQLISYHFKVKSIITDVQIPLFYVIAMGVDAATALVIGKTYDKIGLKSLLAIPLLTFPIPFFALSHNYGFVIISVALWGAVMGIHETIMRAGIADLVPIERRGFAYGIFNTIYGASWFLGGIVMGLLYDYFPAFIILFVIIMEVISLPIFFLPLRKVYNSSR
jgi:MFS family permease